MRVVIQQKKEEEAKCCRKQVPFSQCASHKYDKITQPDTQWKNHQTANNNSFHINHGQEEEKEELIIQ